ncbi:MAG: S8 family peptidase [Cytophagales bacterium]|nr:S8 family peptidase [Cytophagales bacterium]
MKNHVVKIVSLAALAVFMLACNEQFSDKGILPNQSNPSELFSQPSNSNLNQTELPNDVYIVVFKEKTTGKEIDDEVREIGRSEGVKADHVFKYAIKGFSARLNPAAINRLRNNPRVDFIEKDQIISINTTQTNVPSWGIDRVDQIGIPLDKSYTYTSNGAGVDAYIIDTGILSTHVDFEGRVVRGYSAIGTSTTNWIDQNGHGTHVSGTVGGRLYGIAKNVNLIAVRVLDARGAGTNSDVLEGIDWVVKDHNTKTNTAVGNMSLGGTASQSLDLAVSNAVAANIVMCVAAGNSNLDASQFSPARVQVAITVGATTNTDIFASYSNWGSIVDILAPGTSITSAYIKGSLKTFTATLSGTSMATPHVAGVVAKFLSQNRVATPSEVEIYLKTSSTKGKITGLRSGTVNALLFSNN